MMQISEKTAKEGCFFDSIFTIKNDTQSYYFATYVAGSRQDCTSGAMLFVVSNDKVSQPKLIKVANNLTNNLRFSWEFRAYDNKYHSSYPRVTLNAEKQLLLVPLIEDIQKPFKRYINTISTGNIL